MSRMQLKPQYYTVLPNNKLRLFVEAVPPPPIWTGITNGQIQADSRVQIVTAPGFVSAFAAQSLLSGGGRIEWTINDNQRPTGGGTLIYSVFNSNLSLKFDVNITATQIFVKDEAGSTIYGPVGYTPTSGDVIAVYIGDFFRLVKNNILLYTRSTGPISYPCSFFVFLSTTVAGASPAIAAPALFGEWKINPNATVTFALQSGSGTLTAISPTEVEYSGNTIPGDHPLIATIASGQDPNNIQRATATLSTPSLMFLGERTITLQPGQKIRPKTNYDIEQGAQTSLVTLAIVFGGGTLTQGEFTAPATPGTTIIRATCSATNTIADLTITTVPAITNANNYIAAKVGEQIDFDVNIPAMPYFWSAGAMAEGTGDISPGLPQAIQANDILLLFVETANEAVSTPSGWAVVADSPQGTGTGGGTTSTRLSVFWKRVGSNPAAEVAPTVTDPGDHAIAQILAFRGCADSGNPWDVTSGDTGASSTSVSIPGDTTTVVNCLVVLAIANATDTGVPQVSGFTNADLANLIERTDVNTSQGNGGGFTVATGERAAIGAYGATTATLANASVQGRMSIALKPAVTTFTTSVGSINSSTGVFTAPSLPGQTARIMATNGTLTVAIEIPILEAFPRTDFILPWPIDYAKRVVLGEAEDGSRTSRIKSGPKRSFPVNLLVDTVADLGGVAGLSTIRAFWDRHHPGVRFILDDPEEGFRMVVYSDSDLRWEHTSAGINIAFRVKEA